MTDISDSLLSGESLTTGTPPLESIQFFNAASTLWMLTRKKMLQCSGMPLDDIIAKHGNRKDSLLPVLQDIQEEYGNLPREVLREICAKIDAAPADIFAALTFDDQFQYKQAKSKPEILADKCKGCTVCIKKCPTGAIIGERKVPHKIDAEKCNNCGECANACKFDAIIGLNSPQPLSQERSKAQQILSTLDRLCEGKGTPKDLAILESVERRVKAEANPVLSTLQHFRSEFEVRILFEGSAQVVYQINENCKGCSICTRHCPVSAILATPYRRHCIDTSACTKCDVCRQSCPHSAIVVIAKNCNS